MSKIIKRQVETTWQEVDDEDLADVDPSDEDDDDDEKQPSSRRRRRW